MMMKQSQFDSVTEELSMYLEQKITNTNVGDIMQKIKDKIK